MQVISSSSLFPFPFCHRKKNKRLKSYNVFRLILYRLFHDVLLEMRNGEKIKNWETEKNYFVVSVKIHLPFLKSVLFICKLDKWSRTTRLQLKKKDLYIKN